MQAKPHGRSEPSFANPVYRRLCDVVSQIEDGDLLLYRRRSLISILGRGIHSHAAKVGIWHTIPFVLEIREWVGGRAVTLQSQVAKYPGRIDVYRPASNGTWPQYSARRSVAYMRGLAGSNYGYLNVLLAGLLHLPFIRLLVRPQTDDRATSKYPPFCSQAVAMAERAGGVDPVPNLADRLTEPCDLARSPFYDYLLTLIVDQPPSKRSRFVDWLVVWVPIWCVSVLLGLSIGLLLRWLS